MASFVLDQTNGFHQEQGTPITWTGLLTELEATNQEKDLAIECQGKIIFLHSAVAEHLSKLLSTLLGNIRLGLSPFESVKKVYHGISIKGYSSTELWKDKVLRFEWDHDDLCRAVEFMYTGAYTQEDRDCCLKPKPEDLSVHLRMHFTGFMLTMPKLVTFAACKAEQSLAAVWDAADPDQTMAEMVETVYGDDHLRMAPARMKLAHFIERDCGHLAWDMGSALSVRMRGNHRVRRFLFMELWIMHWHFPETKPIYEAFYY